MGNSLRSGGLMLIGESYWRRRVPDRETAQACHASGEDDFLVLPELIERFGDLGTTS